jgi:hypothetical protein
MSEKDYTKQPGLTATGKPWYQKCFICLKNIDLIKTDKQSLVFLGNGMVMHKKCYPKAYKGK